MTPEHFTPEQIALVCHQANNAVKSLCGQDTAEWDDLPQSTKTGVINAVRLVQQRPSITNAEIHAKWMQDRLAQGWTLGPGPDPVNKRHPNLVAYDALPLSEKRKDSVFLAVVRALTA
jgi:hypothetical protein